MGVIFNFEKNFQLNFVYRPGRSFVRGCGVCLSEQHCLSLVSIRALDRKGCQLGNQGVAPWPVGFTWIVLGIPASDRVPFFFVFFLRSRQCDNEQHDMLGQGRSCSIYYGPTPTTVGMGYAYEVLLRLTACV